VIVLIIVLASSSSSPSRVNQEAINWKTPSGLQVYGGTGPEGIPVQVGPELAPANAGLTGATIAAVGCSSSEQTAYHHHIHLVIFINGQPRSVPIAIGFTPPAELVKTDSGYFAEAPGGANPCLYWLHVHAQDGIVHIESPIAETFVLGQFFAVWQQPLSSNQVGPYKGTVTATVNGVPWVGDPSLIPLDEHAQVVLNLGAPVVTPPPISWSGSGH
jgi:hypothetical protein